MPSALHTIQKFFPGVSHVEDSEKDIEVEVTKRDNAVATRRSHKTCAMAVACKRKMRLDGVVISMHTAYLVKGRRATRFMLPERVSREVISFDRNGEFADGEYTLHAPDEHHKLGFRHVPIKPVKKSGKRVRRYHVTKNVRTALMSKMAAE